MKKNQALETPRGASPVTAVRLFAGVAGMGVALILLKLGNPVILDSQVEAPRNWLEVVYSPWPARWGYVLLGIIALAGLFAGRLKPVAPKWLLVLPLLWLGWQLVSAISTVRPDLTQATLPHFVACVVCFYLGLFALSQVPDLRPFWVGLIAGLAIVLWVGFNQHYGGLEQTRQAFQELQTNWNQVSPEVRRQLDTPEFRQKMTSNRIFSTLVYPNALAGVIILLLPASLWALWNISRGANPILRKVLVGIFGYAGLACLYWSQSKAGWLILLVIALLAFLHLPVAKRLKWVMAGIILVAGLTGFALKYSGYFSRGAKSAIARTDYWQAAWKLSLEKPLLGTGPGTFMVGYKRLKAPESEMTRLVHNDYLQQAADSGWPGFLFYSAFVWGSMGLLYWRLRKLSLWEDGGNALAFCAWLGVTGLALQSLVEFGLYIPALAWPFFLLLGWLWGRAQPAGA